MHTGADPPYLVVKGKKLKASQQTTALATPVTYVDVLVAQGQTFSVG
jgi:hypothetical protein